MSLFQGSAPDPVELTKTSSAQAPEYLTNYLTGLAQAGMGALGTVTPGTAATDTTPGTPPSVTPFTGQELIAKAPAYYQNLISGQGVDQSKLPGLGILSRYQTPMDEALKAGQSAMDVGATDISKFYDPFNKDVISKIEQQGQLNLQRNILPALKALGVSGMGGALGSARTGAISGQALADFVSRLEGEKLSAQQAMYKNAIDAALKEQGQQSGVATALSGLGAQEQTAATQGLKSLSYIGAAKLAYDQSLIEAPLKRAMNVAEIMRGYTYPTKSTETAETIPTVMGPSPLSQIAGLGTLVGAAFPTDPKTGKIGGLGGFLGDLFKSGATGQAISDAQWAANPDWAGY